MLSDAKDKTRMIQSVVAHALQNWAHVEAVFEALDKVPQEQHGVDIMRVREWALSGWAAHYR